MRERNTRIASRNETYQKKSHCGIQGESCLGGNQGREDAGGPDVGSLHAKIGQQAMEIDFLAVALGSHGRYERKKMIDKSLALSVTRQAELLDIGRARTSITCRKQCHSRTWR